MIVVTGTKRSGTSMWMQILAAAGFEPIGEEFPLDWGTRLRELNPRGFWESRLRTGINFTTNPDPVTGYYLAPEDCQRSCVKVFAPGVVCTDLAYLDCVIGTMREWRAYSRSRERLEEIDLREDVPDDVRFAARYNLPAHLEWWVENYALLRDAITRRYPFTLFTYESVAGGQLDIIDETIDWLGFGDVAAARAAVTPRAIKRAPTPDIDIGDHIVAVFDELYERVHTGASVGSDFIERLDETHEELLPEFAKHVSESAAAVARLREAASTDALNLRRNQ